MSHFGARNRAADRLPNPEWLPVTRDVGRIVNQWSRRKDLVAYVSEDGGRGKAAALFDPTTNEIEICIPVAFGPSAEPEDVGDFTQRSTHYKFPKAAGAVLHEAMHAQHTIMDLPSAARELGRKMFEDIFMMLEEGRIEAYGVRQYPKNREFLRTCALEIVLAESNDPVQLLKDAIRMGQVRYAARTAMLSIARVDAGVLKMKDIQRLKGQIEDTLTIPTVRKLRVLWKEFQALSHTDLTRMYEITREIDELLTEQSKANGEGEGSPEDDDLGDIPDWLKELMKALRSDATSTQISAGDAIDTMESQDKAAEEAERVQKESKEQKENEQAGKNTFEISSGPVGGQVKAPLDKVRPPTDEERAVSKAIARAMQNAKYRDRLTTVKMSELPPGRLRTNAAMQGAAARSLGSTTRVLPFRQTTHRHVEDPTLRVGIMCDVSSSMGGSMPPMASATWVIQEAVRHIQGKAAALLFGGGVRSILKPGEHLDQVTQYLARDGVENFDLGFRSLDGALNLLNGNGARLLVVVSDGQYGGSGQLEACYKWLDQCRRKGVGVVWIALQGRSDRANDICLKFGAQFVEISDQDVVGASAYIGRACTTALTKASR